MRHETKTFKAVIAYDGTDYHGWQRQKNSLTIQEVFENALFKITREKTFVRAAGRTDAGVHAKGQVASFALSSSAPKPNVLKRALNGVLPADIRVMSLSYARKNFNARDDAKRKIYSYKIYNGSVLSPFERRYVLKAHYPLNCDNMKRGLKAIVGKYDFRAFCGSGNYTRGTVRTVYGAALRKRGRYITARVCADGFLKYMVRNIVGSIILVGKGALTAQDVSKILKSKKAHGKSHTAPPNGLTLEKVVY